jgi:FkbM family methyltransferase
MSTAHDPTGSRPASDPLRLALDHFQAGRLLQAETLCQQALASDPSDTEAFRLHERICVQLDQAVRRALQAFQQTPESATTMGAVRRARMDMVSFLQLQPDDSLSGLWESPFRDLYKNLLKSGIRDFPRNPAEETVAERLRPESQSRLASLLAAMLLCRNYEMPVREDLIALPEWLREDYIGYMFEMPEIYHRPGEAEIYADYICRLMPVARGLAITANGVCEDPAVRRVVMLIVRNLIVMQTYFATRNLREPLAQRGDLISAGVAIIGINPLMAIPPRDARGGKIRLGIFAEHFGSQTETYFTLSHFAHLDRTRFDISLYAVRKAVTRRDRELEQLCIAHADRFVADVGPIQSLVERMREDDLDVLLIGTNLSALSNAASIMGSARIAPVQIASVSTPTTTGCRHVDAILSAQWNEPEPDAADHYIEHLYKMPESVNYYCFHLDRDAATIDVDRAKLGIAPEQVIFFSGAVNYKILPEVSRLWIEILAAVPSSVLVLMPFNPNWSVNYRIFPFMERLNRQMADRGLPSHRLRVVNAVPSRADVHRVIAMADVYLDAYPFSGACSLIDPIMVGVPMVARKGPVGRSNHAASLLRLVGLEEWVTNSDGEYIAAAVSLAGDPAKRQRIREHLQSLRAADPPPYFDIPKFSARVGEAIEDLYGRYQARYHRLAALGDDDLKGEIQRLADSVVGHNFELTGLTDTGLIKALIEPFFRAHRPRDRTPHMIDVGACHGEMSAPFLAAGWTADLFEPDPGARKMLQDGLSAFASQCRIHASAIINSTAEKMSFHKAATHGLSGLAGSPFGPTESIIEVPVMRLADFYRREGIEAVDFLKIDAEGYDFDALDSHDFSAIKPRLIMVEYGTHFARQTLETVSRAVARMRAAGYGAIAFNYTDDGSFAKAKWRYRLIDVFVDREIPSDRTSAFGNIVFYRTKDREFLLTLHSLLECCVQPRRAVWDS